MIWSSDRDKTIRLYLKILENLVQLIFEDEFWFVHIPFVLIVKFKLLAQLYPLQVFHTSVSLESE